MWGFGGDLDWEAYGFGRTGFFLSAFNRNCILYAYHPVYNRIMQLRRKAVTFTLKYTKSICSYILIPVWFTNNDFAQHEITRPRKKDIQQWNLYHPKNLCVDCIDAQHWVVRKCFPPLWCTEFWTSNRLWTWGVWRQNPRISSCCWWNSLADELIVVLAEAVMCWSWQHM